MALLDALDIVNAACARVGADPVQSLGEETTGGQSYQLLYDDVVSFNLGLYQFSWSRTIRQLSKISGATPLSGFDHVYDLPPERNGPPLYVTDDVTDPNRRFDRYALLEKQVHSSADPLFACIKIKPDPHLWSATFRSCTITALASRLALSLASDRQTSEMLRVEAYGTPQENFRGGQMRAAIGEDSFSTPPRAANFDRNPLTSAWRR